MLNLFICILCLSVLFSYSKPFVCKHSEDNACKVALITLTHVNNNNTINLICSASDTMTIHRLDIESRHFISNLADIIDQYLMVSPWWVIHKEVYNHVVTNSPLNNHSYISTISLIRYNSTFEMALHRLAAKQYVPSNEICESTSVFIGRMINSGWGSQADMYLSGVSFDYGIFNTWYTRTNNIQEELLIMNQQDCYTNSINKWECVFLPLTNCSMSKCAFAQCHAEADCLQNQLFKLVNLSGMDNTIITGGPVWDRLGREKTIPYHAQLDIQYPHVLQKLSVSTMKNVFINSRNELTMWTSQPSKVLFHHGLLFRLNHGMRSRVHRVIQDSYKSRAIPFVLGKDACVAMHIRRGDRTVHYPVNNTSQEDGSKKDPEPGIISFCRLFTKNGRIAGHNCSTNDLIPMHGYRPPGEGFIDCQRLADLGCFCDHPFGSLTLIDYLYKSQRIYPHAHNVFIMTDDNEWLQDQKKKLKKSNTNVSHYTIGTLYSDPYARLEHHPVTKKKTNGTKSTLDFWSGVAISKYCQAFVGHFGSAVSDLIYSSMCFQHDVYTGLCPPAVDIGGDRAW